MGKKSPVRYQLFLPEDVAERFEDLAAQPGATKSSILAAALTTFLNRRGASEAEERFAIRLDRISSQLVRIERDGNVSLESLGLFIRYMLTVNAPLAEDDEVARAIGRDRFAAFVVRVGQTLASGRRTLEPETSDERG
ncbi:MAG TPA: CopG family transcriptional regulator [Allosphingosinicella sp.]